MSRESSRSIMTGQTHTHTHARTHARARARARGEANSRRAQ